jgi:hypothetical protein
MAQVTLYIDEPTQARLREAAARQQVSQSQYVADLIRRATDPAWPDEVLALAGSVPDFPGVEALREGLPPDTARAAW